MKKNSIFCGALMLLAAQASAGENYNYSYLEAIASFDSIEIADKKPDGKSYGLDAQYELSSIPLVLRGGFRNGSIDDTELTSGSEINVFSYGAGAKLVISPTSRLDILPGAAISRIESEVVNNGNKAKTKTNAYTASLDTRFHLERGLWLKGGIAYTDYKDNSLDKVTSYSIGADYQVDDIWALGVEYNWSSDATSTALFVRIFY